MSTWRTGALQDEVEVEVDEVKEVQTGVVDEVKAEQKWSAAKCSKLSPRMG